VRLVRTGDVIGLRRGGHVNGYHLKRRLWVAGALVVLVALTVAGVTALTGHRPAVAASHRAAGQVVLTVRTSGGHDALWLVPPAGGTPTAAGTLPGVAGSCAVSPDGANVAYLPASAKPSIWIGYGALAPKTIALGSAGVKRVGSMTWISADQLLISASANPRYYDLRAARLYTVDVRTGSVKAFRGLSGAEPNADPVSGKVAYVRFTKLDGGTARNNQAHLYRESLMLLSLSGSGAGRLLSFEQYRLYADQRAFSQPLLARGAKWVLTGRTGSDVRVTYALYDAGLAAMPWLTVFAPAVPAAAWAPDGGRVAFGGVVPSGDFADACIYVDDVSSGALTRTQAALLPGASIAMITGVAWSNDGMLAADARVSDHGAANDHVFVLRGDDLSTLKDLGQGHLSVWVP
jgi:hypothetical protein